MRCMNCDIIPLTEIPTPADYMVSLETFIMMTKAGVLEIVYQNHPIELVFAGHTGNKVKFFHQFRCKNCGTIYGMFVNTLSGGEIKINDKVFDPAEYGSSEIPGGESR